MCHTYSTEFLLRVKVSVWRWRIAEEIDQPHFPLEFMLEPHPQKDTHTRTHSTSSQQLSHLHFLCSEGAVSLCVFLHHELYYFSFHMWVLLLNFFLFRLIWSSPSLTDSHCWENYFFFRFYVSIVDSCVCFCYFTYSTMPQIIYFFKPYTLD